MQSSPKSLNRMPLGCNSFSCCNYAELYSQRTYNLVTHGDVIPVANQVVFVPVSPQHSRSVKNKLHSLTHIKQVCVCVHAWHWHEQRLWNRKTLISYWAADAILDSELRPSETDFPGQEGVPHSNFLSAALKTTQITTWIAIRMHRIRIELYSFLNVRGVSCLFM